MATVDRAYFRSKRHAVICGFVQNTVPMPSEDGRGPAETRQAAQERLLSWHRTLLIRELAQRRKAHKATCLVIRDLREATTAILAMGQA